jgi:uroporphyrinogen decarboxylase
LFYVGKEAEFLGCKEVLYSEEGPPNVLDFVIKNREDIYTLKIPENLMDEPSFQETKICLDILKREVKGKYPICVYATASMALPALLMGMDKWFDLLYSDDEARDVLLEKCLLFFQKEVEAYRTLGADVVLYSNPFGSTDVVPMKTFQSLSLKWMRKEFNLIGVHDVVYYCGMARMGEVIEQIISEFGIKAFYLSPLDDLGKAIKVISGRAFFAGVINDIPLIDWNVEKMTLEIQKILDLGMPEKRFMFGTGLMPFAIPEKSIRFLVDYAVAHGKR